MLSGTLLCVAKENVRISGHYAIDAHGTARPLAPTLPACWIAAVVQAGDDEDTAGPDLEEQAVWERLGETRTTHIAKYAGELLGAIGQAGHGGIERDPEPLAKTGRRAVIPLLGLVRLGFSDRRKKYRPHLVRTALLKSRPDILPRTRLRLVLLYSFEAPHQLCPLGLGHRRRRTVRGFDAVPEGIDQREPLLNRHLCDLVARKLIHRSKHRLLVVRPQIRARSSCGM